MILEYASMAISNLRKRGIRSLLTMLGIFIGIAAVVSLISLGNGLQSAITGQFSSLDPNKLIVKNAETGFGPPGSTAIEKLNSHDLAVIEQVNGVDEVLSRLVRVVELNYNDISKYRYVADIPEEPDEIDVVYDALNVDLEIGRMLTSNDRGKVLLGNDFTDDSFDKIIKVGTKLTIQDETFEVVGILKQASTFQTNTVILMPRQDLKNILDIDDEIDIIVVQVQDQDELGKVTEDIEKALRKDRNLDEGDEDFSVETPEQTVQTINTILVAINIVVTGIAAISLFVGGIGIANTMYTSILERTKEIGIMKAIGAHNKDILWIFLTESAVLGLVGGVIGAVIGLGFAYLVAFGVNYQFPGLSFGVNFSPSLLGLSILFSLIIGVVSGILPAFQASKLHPVEALRK